MRWRPTSWPALPDAQPVEPGERQIVPHRETSGKVIEGLSLFQLDIEPEIAPAVPMMRAGNDLVGALKSGKFGVPLFFDDVARMMEAPQ